MAVGCYIVNGLAVVGLPLLATMRCWWGLERRLKAKRELYAGEHRKVMEGKGSGVR